MRYHKYDIAARREACWKKWSATVVAPKHVHDHHYCTGTGESRFLGVAIVRAWWRLWCHQHPTVASRESAVMAVLQIPLLAVVDLIALQLWLAYFGGQYVGNPLALLATCTAVLVVLHVMTAGRLLEAI